MIHTTIFDEGYKTASLTLGNPPLSVTATTTEATGVLAAYDTYNNTFGGRVLPNVYGRNFYVEFTLTTMGAGKNIAVGFKTSADPLATLPGADATSFGFNAALNQVRKDGAAAIATGWSPAPAQGDIIGFLLDEVTGGITVYHNGANPVTSLGNATSGTYYPAVYLFDSGDSVLLNCGLPDGDTFSALPAGKHGWDFNNWPGQQRHCLLSTTDKTASVTLGDYGYSALATAVNTAVGARNLTYTTTGTGSGGGPDRYCEFTLTAMAATNIAVGLTTSDDAVASIPGNVATSAGYYVNTNLVKVDNGTGVATGWTAPAAGAVLGMRVNMVSGLVTFYKNGVAATNTVTLTAGSYAPHIYLFTQNDKVTLNAGGPSGAGFTYLPAGCIGWNVDLPPAKHFHNTVASPRPVQHIRL